MTLDEKTLEGEHQALDFAHGNLACTNNHKPDRVAFKKLALQRGWSEEQFEAWAKDYTWG